MDEHNEVEGMYPSRVLASLGNVGHSIDCFSMPSRAPLHQGRLSFHDRARGKVEMIDYKHMVAKFMDEWQHLVTTV